MILRARQFEFCFPRPALVMGVLNVTPDSFSDGGQHFGAAEAVDRGAQMAAEGADLIDVGGESTRPHATPVEQSEELRRVLPVIEKLAGRLRVPISIDTMKPAVARAALEAGASMINDVAAHREEDLMWRVAAEYGAGYVAMHMQGNPRSMQSDPRYQDVLGEVAAFFHDRLRRLSEAGVADECVLLDVGIGFGKTVEHNLQLLGGLRRFTTLGRPLLVAASRKSFIGHITGVDRPEERVAGSLACACLAVAFGAHMIRTHDVAATRQALRAAEAVLAHQKP